MQLDLQTCRIVPRLAWGWRCAIAASFLALASVSFAADPPADSREAEFFELKIRPLLVMKCHACHSSGEEKGGLSLESAESVKKGGKRGTLLVPGQPDSSLIVQAIERSGEIKMPPDEPLTAEEIADIRAWISKGAVWPATVATATAPSVAEPDFTPEQRDFWAFRPIVNPPLPSVRGQSWPIRELDHFVLSALEQRGLAPVRSASRSAWIRRATFDLIGLPPTREEVRNFELDNSPEAHARVIDRLLASPHYGERWGRHWLDVARYGEDQAHTFDARQYPQGYRYRDWVVQSLNADMHFDRFVSEQLAGDLLEGGDPRERAAALGFIALGPVYYKDAGCADKAALDELDDRVDTLTRGLLGLTGACARCHHHKFDPISQHDYYALAGIFRSSEYREVPIDTPEAVAAYDAGQKRIEEQKQAIEKFKEEQAKTLTAAKGKEVKKDEVADNLDESGKKQLEMLDAELKERIKNAPPKYEFVHSISEGNSADMELHIRGNPTKVGDKVPRRFLKILGGETGAPFQEGSGRLSLARAIASRDNPLTARVIVNRIWQQHFGAGIVATASNFGKLGERPSHPELLDYLAWQLMQHEWSLKWLHKEIMLSAVYRLSSDQNEDNSTIDADNRYLWRMNRRRLDVEAYRDAFLAVSGLLDRSLGGPPGNLADGSFTRRTLYGAVSRHQLDGMLRLFDFPDPNITVDRRAVTTVPLQQLFLLNSEFIVRQSKALAAKLQNEAPDNRARLNLAHEILFARPATAAEISLGLEYLQNETAQPTEDDKPAGDPLTPWERLAQALLASNEFLHVD